MSRDRTLTSFFVIGRATAAVALRPGLWTTAVRAVRRTAPDRWWRRKPFLPVPTRDYLEFRLSTQYGSAAPTDDIGADLGADIVSYLEWCRSLERRS